MSASGVGVPGRSTGSPDTIETVEYHHAEWDHYFMTGDLDEIAKLDNGTFAGRARTGQQFNAFPMDSAIGTSVCRFIATRQTSTYVRR